MMPMMGRKRSCSPCGCEPGDGCWYKLPPCAASIFGDHPCGDLDPGEDPDDLYVPCDHYESLALDLDETLALQFEGHCYQAPPVAQATQVTSLPDGARVGSPVRLHQGCETCAPNPFGVCCYDEEEECTDFTACQFVTKSQCRQNLAGYWRGPCDDAGNPIDCSTFECDLPEETAHCCQYESNEDGYCEKEDPSFPLEPAPLIGCVVEDPSVNTGCTFDGGDGRCCQNDVWDLGPWGGPAAHTPCECCGTHCFADDLGNATAPEEWHDCFCPAPTQESQQTMAVRTKPQFDRSDVVE